MSETYRVRAGDCLFTIAETYGMDWRRIWDDGANADLRRRRGNPNLLYPGDELHVPTADRGGEQAALEQPHRFRIQGKFAVRMVVYDEWHKPLANVPYHYTVEGVDQPAGVTGADGVAEILVAKSVQDVDLHLPWATLPILLGHLDPANTARGAQQRLTNLGFDPGPHDGVIGPRTRAALAAFQRVESAKLEITGLLNRATVIRLRELHDGESLPGAPEDWDSTPPTLPEVEAIPAPRKTMLDYEDIVYQPEPGAY